MTYAICHIKIMYCLEIIAAIGLKVVLSIQVNELMILKSNKGLGHYLILAKGHSDVRVKACISQKVSEIHAKVKFCMGKSKNYVLFGNYCSHRPESCFKHSGK